MSFPYRLNLPETFSLNEMQWKLPFGLAVSLHLLVFIFFILPAGFLLPERDFEEVQTINLFTAAEVKELQAPPRAKAKTVKRSARKKAQASPPPIKRDVKSIAIDQPEVAAKAGKVVSLHPRKLKKRAKTKKVKSPVKKEDNRRLKALERIQARINQKEEEAKLRHDLSRLRESLHTTPEPTNEPVAEQDTGSDSTEVRDNTSSAASNSSGGGSSSNTAFLDEAMKRYYIAISRRIHNHWALPETQIWDKNLEAVAVIVIQRNGAIAKTFFEKKSKNIYFDQYVVKSIQAAAPLPPFPADLKKRQIEIGLRFRPSGLF